jgi:hypothetical protein
MTKASAWRGSQCTSLSISSVSPPPLPLWCSLFPQRARALSRTLLEEEKFVVSSASGSALNGIQFFPLRQSPSSPPSGRALGLCCAGYDQRLGVWEVCLPASPLEMETRRSCPGDQDCPLRWLGGSLVNIGDVNSLALLAQLDVPQAPGGECVTVAVVGEGFQLFELRDK